MKTVSEIFEYLCRLAPLQLQMDFDNSGLLLGNKETSVEKVLLALDVTDAVVDEAIELGAQLIVSHHPLIFSPIKAITDKKLLKLVENSIAVVSMHTNLDIAPGGVNDVLMSVLGANTTDVLDEHGCGRVGVLAKAINLEEFLVECKKVLCCKGIRYYSANRPVKNIAVMGGSGADELETAFAKGCDTYLTADIKYHQFLRAAELGINLIDADHFCTENPVIPVLKNVLQNKFNEIEFFVSEKHCQIINFI